MYIKNDSNRDIDNAWLEGFVSYFLIFFSICGNILARQ